MQMIYLIIRKKNFVDSAPALFAYSALAIGAIPDFALSILTVIVYVPENVLERFFDELVDLFMQESCIFRPKSIKPNSYFPDSLKLLKISTQIHI